MVKVFFSDSDKLFSKLIKYFTWSEFSHVGLINDATGTVIDSRYGLGGVSEYDITKLYTDYPKLIVVELPFDGEGAFEMAKTQLGKKYDLGAIFGMTGRRDWQTEDSWFCSELVAWACAEAGKKLIRKKANRVTPQDLWEILGND